MRLLFQRERYSTYVRVLRQKLHIPPTSESLSLRKTATLQRYHTTTGTLTSTATTRKPFADFKPF